MKVNIVLQFDFEKLDNIIKRFEEMSKETSKSLDDLFLIMSSETGRGFADKLSLLQKPKKMPLRNGRKNMMKKNTVGQLINKE